MMNFTYDYHFQKDGSKAGYKGYPYLLNSLLKEHNKTTKYETLNFASDNFTLLPGAQDKTYKDTCEYRQLMTSQPDVVIAMLGAKESMNTKNFTPDAFVAAYSNFIKEMKSLPSKPLFFLITPIYYSKTILKNGKGLLVE